MCEQSPSDAGLIEAHLSGSPTALMQLWMRYDRLVYGTAHGMLSHRETAEDIRQEVFLKVYTNLSSLQDTDRFAAWVHRITRNTCNTWLRRCRPATALDDIDEPADPSEWVSVTFEHHEQRTWLRKTIDRLPMAYRTVVELYYFEDQRIAQIAEFLDVKGSTIKSRLHQARAMLKQTARLEGIVDGDD